MDKKLIILATVIIVVIVIAADIFSRLSYTTNEVHEHADFAVYINGERLSFEDEKYMSDENSTLSLFVHSHDMDGDVIHKHARNITMGDFFESLGFIFNSTCFSTDTGEEYCENEEKSLKMFVNGKENNEYEDYEFTDLDRILISYGPAGENISSQVDSVTDKACISSGKCPERGMPTDEPCSILIGCIE